MRGKVNAVTMDQCSKTALVFENVVASCEIVNSRSVQVFVPQTPSSPDSPLCIPCAFVYRITTASVPSEWSE